MTPEQFERLISALDDLDISLRRIEERVESGCEHIARAITGAAPDFRYGDAAADLIEAVRGIGDILQKRARK